MSEPDRPADRDQGFASSPIGPPEHDAEWFTDRPGDRDQQQAARVLIADALRSEMQPDTSWDRRDVDDLADALMAHAVPAALAAARAEEAARWQAKIEALLRRGFVADPWGRLRAVLDGEQR